MTNPAPPSELESRYSRQIRFAPIGLVGQQRLRACSAVLVGCGALGSVLASLLVRAGIGRLRIIDRDFVEPSNLHRQLLFDEDDAQQLLPKAVAAVRKLSAANRDVQLEAEVADLTSHNAHSLLSGFSLLLDGTDNFETRFLLNDVSIALGVPWVYSAVVGAYGVTMAIVPGETACLACVLPPGADPGPTCETAGVLNAAAAATAALAAAAALRLLTGHGGAGVLVGGDFWKGSLQRVAAARNPGCAACARHQLRYLSGQAQPHITLCGRNSVQIHERRRQLDLAALAEQLRAVAQQVRGNDYLLRFRVEDHEVTVFADGRAVVHGTQDPAVARSLYARYIGC